MEIIISNSMRIQKTLESCGELLEWLIIIATSAAAERQQ
jgi:hypothetical protein